MGWLDPIETDTTRERRAKQRSKHATTKGGKKAQSMGHKMQPVAKTCYLEEGKEGRREDHILSLSESLIALCSWKGLSVFPIGDYGTRIRF